MNAARVRRLLRYDPKTGVVRWRVPRGSKSAGHVAGNLNVQLGCVQIRLDRRLHYAHRLIWLMQTGEWPSRDIDHKDGDPSNNRWENLRLATKAQNVSNQRRRSDNTSGYKGVYFAKRYGTWYAQIWANQKYHFVGSFASAEEAAYARRLATKRLHGRFANPGMTDAEWDRRWRWFICSRVWVD